jgi:hypothetical protein
MVMDNTKDASVVESSQGTTRRQFLDILAKTTIATGAFTLLVFAGGCGSGNKNVAASST